MIDRRQVLKLGAGVLGIAGLGAGYTAYRWRLPPPSANLRAPGAIAKDFLATLDPELRSRVQVDYEHPYRQYHNEGIWTKSAEAGIHLGEFDFSSDQRALIVDLLHSGLSKAGHEVIPRQLFFDYHGALYKNIVICGEPESDTCQIIFTGIHLNLRIGGQNREGVAFGGPQVYGDQAGNEVPGLPGNVYRPQFIMATSLFESLDRSQQAAAVLPNSPIQTQIEVQGSAGIFAGLPVAELTSEQQLQVTKIINQTFAPYPDDDVAYAWECIEANGGVSGLHLSYYEDSRYDESGSFQNYRLEGPAAVFFFQGIPHVHGFFNVAMDGEAPLSVGETVAMNDTLLEGVPLVRLFERAMVDQTGADFAYYGEDSVVGRLRPGLVRTGDIYNAENWQNEVIELSVRGADIRGALLRQMKLDNVVIEPARHYRVVTTNYVVDEQLDTAIGSAVRVRDHGFLRHHVVNYAKANGFG